MKTDDSAGPSLGQGIQRYLAILLDGAKFRGELMAVEWQEEKQRLFTLMVISALSALAGALTLASLNILLLLVYWDSHRVAVTVGFIVLYAVLAVALAWIAHRRIHSRRTPFQATLEELRRDRDRFLSGG